MVEKYEDFWRQPLVLTLKIFLVFASSQWKNHKILFRTTKRLILSSHTKMLEKEVLVV
jgi:hypothetical protein